MAASLRPPIVGFEPFEPARVLRVRAEREARWLRAQTAPEKKPRKSSSTPSEPAIIPGVPLDQQAAVRQALKNLGLAR